MWDKLIGIELIIHIAKSAVASFQPDYRQLENPLAYSNDPDTSFMSNDVAYFAASTHRRS